MKFRYVPELDGLRGIAILAVMGFHVARHYVPGGALGVDVFFVLSGYLITSLLLSEQESKECIDYLGFLWRRAKRLLPALFVLLAVYVIAAPFVFPHTFGPRRWFDTAAAATYTMNLMQTISPGTTADSGILHTWSLSIEEQFYLLWPIVVAMLVRMDRAMAIAILIGTWLVITAVRTVLWLHFPDSHPLYYFTVPHCTGLIVGSVLAFRPWPLRFGRLALGGLALFFVFGDRDNGGQAMLQPLAEILTALVLVNTPAVLNAAPLRFLGAISYGVYLWHFFIFKALGWPDHSLGLVVMTAVLSVVMGWLSYKLIEQPFVNRMSREASHPLTAMAMEE